MEGSERSERGQKDRKTRDESENNKRRDTQLDVVVQEAGGVDVVSVVVEEAGVGGGS